MTTRLIQIVSFPAVDPSGSLTLPHEINLSGVPQAPDFVAVDAPGFAIAVTAVDVTVTNNNSAPTAVNVWLELKHSIARELGNAQGNPFESLSPRPFVASGGGVGASFPDITDIPTFQGPTSPNPGIVIIGPDSVPSGVPLVAGGLRCIGEFLFDNVSLVQPDPFAGVNNDVPLAGSAVWIFDTDVAGGTITGIEVDGPGASNANFTNTGSLGGVGVKLLFNVGLGNLTIAHDNAGSQPENRFQLAGSANKVIPVNGGALAIYAQGGWRLVGIST